MASVRGQSQPSLPSARSCVRLSGVTLHHALSSGHQVENRLLSRCIHFRVGKRGLQQCLTDSLQGGDTASLCTCADRPTHLLNHHCITLKLHYYCSIARARVLRRYCSFPPYDHSDRSNRHVPTVTFCCPRTQSISIASNMESSEVSRRRKRKDKSHKQRSSSDDAHAAAEHSSRPGVAAAASPASLNGGSTRGGEQNDGGGKPSKRRKKSRERTTDTVSADASLPRANNTAATPTANMATDLARSTSATVEIADTSKRDPGAGENTHPSASVKKKKKRNKKKKQQQEQEQHAKVYNCMRDCLEAHRGFCLLLELSYM